MTSHYVCCIVKGSFDAVFNAIGDSFGNIYARKLGKLGEPRFGIILGEHYFFRVENDAAVLIVLKELSSDETKVEIVSCAGGHGLLSISQGAHADYVHDVEKLLADSGFEVQLENEIDYFDREKCARLLGEGF